MRNKRVLVIPSAYAVRKYAKEGKGSLRVAVYVEKLFPYNTVQGMFATTIAVLRWRMDNIYA